MLRYSGVALLVFLCSLHAQEFRSTLTGRVVELYAMLVIA